MPDIEQFEIDKEISEIEIHTMITSGLGLFTNFVFLVILIVFGEFELQPFGIYIEIIEVIQFYMFFHKPKLIRVVNNDTGNVYHAILNNNNHTSSHIYLIITKLGLTNFLAILYCISGGFRDSFWFGLSVFICINFHFILYTVQLLKFYRIHEESEKKFIIADKNQTISPNFKSKSQ
jgi:hypothetical protein